MALHLRILCVKFGQNSPSGSGEEVKKFIDEQTDRQFEWIDGWKDGDQTKTDQKSSLELSVQVS